MQQSWLEGPLATAYNSSGVVVLDEYDASRCDKCLKVKHPFDMVVWWESKDLIRSECPECFKRTSNEEYIGRNRVLSEREKVAREITNYPTTEGG